MACQFYKDTKFRAESRERIEICNEIIEDYLSQDLRLTLRQLYYQLVSRNIITNEEKSYKNLGSLVADARTAGLMDWDAIEDRVRVPRIPSDYRDVNELLDVALASYRLPRWKGQSCYVELWVEKDALAGVLRPIADQFHVTLMVNRGYSSASAMRESALRFINAAEEEDTAVEELHLLYLYLGDHDPSGEDMVRDVEDRLRLFDVPPHMLTVTKVALTMEQVRQYKPPPNPTKISDSRAAAYISKYGESSWEVDALRPEVLASLIRKKLSLLVDQDLVNEIKKQEEKDKDKLRKAVSR